MTITQTTERSAINPLATPAHYGALGDALGLGFGDEGFGFKLIGKEGEEDLLLVKGFDGRKGDTLGAFDELVGLRHMEDELIADELGKLVIFIGTLQPNIIRQNGRTILKK